MFALRRGQRALPERAQPARALERPCEAPCRRYRLIRNMRSSRAGMSTCSCTFQTQHQLLFANVTASDSSRNSNRSRWKRLRYHMPAWSSTASLRQSHPPCDHLTAIISRWKDPLQETMMAPALQTRNHCFSAKTEATQESASKVATTRLARITL